MFECTFKREAKTSQSEGVSYSDKQSDLLSVEPFDLSEFHENGQFCFKRNYLRKDAYNDSEIEQYFNSSTSSQFEINYLEPISPEESLLQCAFENKLQGSSTQPEQKDIKEQSDCGEEQALLNFHKGHMNFFSKTKNPIFPQSRKFMKTKKKTQRNQSYYVIASKYMTNQCRDSCKRFDQRLQEEFKNLSPEEREDKDVTYEAIRHLVRASDATSKNLLKNHREKYLKKRHLAVFLDNFVKGFDLKA